MRTAYSDSIASPPEVDSGHECPAFSDSRGKEAHRSAYECAAESIAGDSVASIPVAFLRPYSSTLPKTANSFRPLTGNPGISLKS